MIEIQILGPLEVRRDGEPLPLGGAKQRALLAALVLRRGQPVAAEQLIDQLWGDRAPDTATKTLQVYVSRLRKLLGADLLLTRGRGYVLAAEPDQVDLDRFESLAAEGRNALEAGEAKLAAEQLHKALALWRGPAIADLAYEPFAQEEIRRLEDARLDALENRIEADLALGRHASLVGELERLHAENPLRERLLGQLMLALYRSDRQADALEAYRRAHRRLRDELGLEPGPRLRELERAILSHDPALQARRGSTLRSRPGSHPRRILFGAGAAALLGVGVAALVIGLGGESASDGGGELLAPNSVARLDPRSGRVLDSIPVASTPARLAVGGNRLWVSSDDARTVSSIDHASSSVSSVISVHATPSDIASGPGGVWVVDRRHGRLLLASPGYRSLAVRRDIPGAATLPAGEDRNTPDPWSVATGAGGVWITDGSRRLLKADPGTGRIEREYLLPDRVSDVAVGAGAVWAVSGPSAEVLRIDPRDGRVTEIPLVSAPRPESPYPIAVAVGNGSVWVLEANTASVTRIDPARRGVTATIPVGVDRSPRRLAVGPGAAWVANGDGTVARIDSSTNSLRTWRIAPSLHDVAVGAGGIWVSSGTGIAGGSLPAAVTVSGGVDPLPSSRCGPIVSAPGARPDYLIASDLPLQGALRNAGSQLTRSIELALRQHGFRAGDFTIGFQACDDSVIGQPSSLTGRCASNMRAYARHPRVLGVIGPFASDCAEEQIAIANSAPGGPLAMISPSNTASGLTRGGPGTRPSEPEIYYPTGVRNYARVVAPDDAQAAAAALLARQVGLRRVFAVGRDDPYGVTVVRTFVRTARGLGLPIVGEGFFRGARAISELARRVARARPDGILVADAIYQPHAAELVRRLHAAAPGARLLAPDGFAYFADVTSIVGPVAEGMYVTQPGVAPALVRGRGEQFVSEFRRQVGGQLFPTTVTAAQAAEVLLDAIAGSDGTRASVTRALLETHVEDGILGNFEITETGDIRPAAITVYRITNGRGVPLRVISSGAD